MEETAIVLISTHGEYPTTQPETLPNDFKMDKISAVLPGVCNFTQNDLAKNIAKYIINTYGKTGIGINDNVLDDISNNIKVLDDTLNETIQRGIKRPSQMAFEDSEFKKFTVASNRSYSNETYHPGEIYYNKRYSISRTEKSRANIYDYGIYLLGSELVQKQQLNNMIENHYDSEDKRYIVYLSNIVDEIYKLGYKRMIIIDISCGFSYELTSRELRTMGRDMRKKTRRGGKRHLKKSRRGAKRHLKNTRKKKS